MMPSAAQALRQHLINIGTLQDQNGATWPSVVGPLPISPEGSDNFIGVMDTGFNQFGRTARTIHRTKKPVVQLMVRSPDYPSGYAQARAIEKCLDQIGVDPSDGGVGPVSVTVEGVRFDIASVKITIPTAPLGQEEQGRRLLFSINCQISMTSYITGTVVFTTPGTSTFIAKSLGREVTDIRVHGQGGGGGTEGSADGDHFQGGGGGGFIGGRPKINPDVLTLTLFGGGLAMSGTLGALTQVVWDNNTSGLFADSGDCGTPIGDGHGGFGSAFGPNVTNVRVHRGGLGGTGAFPSESGGTGGGGAGSLGDGFSGLSSQELSDQGKGGSPDGGSGSPSSSGAPGSDPGGGGAGDFAAPTAGGKSRIEVDYQIVEYGG